MVAGVEPTVHVYPLLGWYNLQQISRITGYRESIGLCSMYDSRAEGAHYSGHFDGYRMLVLAVR